MSQEVKKQPSKGNIVLALVSLVRFFFGKMFILSASQMCSLNFNYYCVLWRYDNINAGYNIKCKSI